MLDDWDHCFPGCEPIGHRLREAFPARWVRFHSLPESKRYPENETEYSEVLARHNAVLQELAGPSGGVVLVTTIGSGSPVPERSDPQVIAFDPDAMPWRTVAMHDIDDNFADPTHWHFFASAWVWRDGKFDPLVRMVADWKLVNVLIVAPDCRWVLHPYDGGMDVVAESPEARRLLQVKHMPWWPARTDGL